MRSAQQTPYILVVDDDEGVCEIVALILGDEGYEVDCATSAGHALTLVEQRRPDLILLDLLMSGQGGQGFVERYRLLPDATAPILVLSGLPDAAQHAARIGADGSIIKPFDLDALVEAVQATMSG
jgi:DNA-binding response OmpR family regulator